MFSEVWTAEKLFKTWLLKGAFCRNMKQCFGIGTAKIFFKKAPISFSRDFVCLTRLSPPRPGFDTRIAVKAQINLRVRTYSRGYRACSFEKKMIPRSPVVWFFFYNRFSQLFDSNFSNQGVGLQTFQIKVFEMNI